MRKSLDLRSQIDSLWVPSGEKRWGNLIHSLLKFRQVSPHTWGQLKSNPPEIKTLKVQKSGLGMFRQSVKRLKSVGDVIKRKARVGVESGSTVCLL